VLDLNEPDPICYRTSGQVAKSLRVSVSTLKRWLDESPALASFRINASGWRLFDESEIDSLRVYQRQRRRNGKTFKPSTLRPVSE
jgi:DNA-binding transcriptional MerR regulator